MLWLRGLIFTVLVPGVLAFYLPSILDPQARIRGGLWQTGWPITGTGALIYLLCLLRFLVAGGTPAIFFTRPLRHVLGQEPAGLVSAGLYRYSRNPMYVGVLLAVLGQAVLFASGTIAVYGAVLWALFHITVVMLEEPHLRATRGTEYEAYCRRVPRWFGLPRRG